MASAGSPWTALSLSRSSQSPCAALTTRISFTNSTTYSCELQILGLLLALSLLNKILILFIGIIPGILLEDLVLVDCGDARAREHRLALPTVPLDCLNRDDHLYFI